MKTITADDGTQYTLENRLDADGQPSSIYYLAEIEPVKKTEKPSFEVVTGYWSYERKTVSSLRVEFKEPILPEPANKLSEAISALVEYTTSTESKIDYHYLDEVLQKKIDEARKSFQESQ